MRARTVVLWPHSSLPLGTCAIRYETGIDRREHSTVRARGKPTVRGVHSGSSAGRSGGGGARGWRGDPVQDRAGPGHAIRGMLGPKRMGSAQRPATIFHNKPNRTQAKSQPELPVVASPRAGPAHLPTYPREKKGVQAWRRRLGRSPIATAQTIQVKVGHE